MAAWVPAVADPPKSDQLAGKIAEVINRPDYKHAHWGILIADLESGETIYELNADKLFAPASTTKLFSTATALDTFGADFRFETPVYRIGDVGERGELLGDLILVASGDLTFGGRTDGHGKIVFKDSDHTYANGNTTAELTEPDPLAGINELARQVHAAGIRRVRGDVLIDDRLFDKAEGSGSGPSSLTPIIINDNVIDLVVTPGSAGEPARVVSRPETAIYQVDALVDTVEKGGDTRVVVSRAGPGRITVRGQIPIGHKPLVRVYEVDDAAAFARGLFIESLRRTGVIVDASPLAPQRSDRMPPGATGGLSARAWPNDVRTGSELPVPPAAQSNRLPRPGADQLTQVATLKSPPFSESIKLILKVSHNLHASTLPLLVATKHGHRSLADGLRYQHEFLARVGVDVDTISFGGGAGGSRADYTTPRATVQLLRTMSKRPDFAVYEAALPVLGVDGTLATSVPPDSPARGKVRAKTGTLYWENTMNNRFLLTSKALAGYATTSRNRRVAFAMFVNNTHIQKSSETSREGKTLGRLCEIIVAEQ